MTQNKPKEERINSIIEAAVSEFLEKGFEGASVDSISKRCGLSKGGFYHHYKNKDEILLAVINNYLNIVNGMIKKAKSNSNSIEAIKTFIHDYLHFWTAHISELQLFHLSYYKIIPRKESWEVMTDYSKKITSFFEAMFIKGIMSGKFIKHNPKSRAVALFSSLQGINAFLVINENFSTDQAVQYFNSIFVDEITK